MKIYLVNIPRKCWRFSGLKNLVSFFMLKYPDQKWSAKTDFKFYKKYYGS